ncbi:MAG: response regulator [Alphaproteobacteria bacterium]|nr:response regulator [Alphaproteobacteria bacterium]
MEILSVNANQKIVNIASSIGGNPQSWQDWFCLHISLAEIDDDLRQECFLWTKSIAESYLQKAEGRVYFCDCDIHIICKDVSQKVLKQAGSQIQDLVYKESSVAPDYELYDLAEEGPLYAQKILQKNSSVFALPVTFRPELAGLPSQDFLKQEQVEAHKHTLKYPNSIKVLLVEDDLVTRWMVRNALKQECELVTASSANRAYVMYSSCQPDLVFLDIDLPDGSGYAVLDWVMRNDPGACVVMFSSNNNLDNITGAFEEGASGFIAKPFLKENLLHYIHKHAGRVSLEKQFKR